MTMRSLRIHGPAVQLPMREISSCPGSKRLLHIGVHNSANRNAGDTLLFPVVRRAFDSTIGPFDWELRQAWEKFTLEDAHRISREFDGIVIGGGGLLLRDQTGSDISNSGWQWNSSIKAVRALDLPLIVYAIGYNRFRGQADFDPVFTDHIRAVAEKSVFFGLRNSGSIRAVQRYLPPDLAIRLRRQFCPTTVLWQLYPEYRELAQRHDAKHARILAFNAAFDRSEHRFGDRAEEVLGQIANAVKGAQKCGWKIIVTAHKKMDRNIEPYLDAVGVEYDTEDLTEAGPDAVMAFYAQVDFAFGMRGHAQMIPFGLRRPILSIISHDKMRFLLEDIQRSSWGVEVDAADLSQRLTNALKRCETEREAIQEDISTSQSAVWDEVHGNLEHIRRTIFCAGV